MEEGWCGEWLYRVFIWPFLRKQPKVLALLLLFLWKPVTVETITFVDPAVENYILQLVYKVFRIVWTVIYCYLFVFIDLLKTNCHKVQASLTASQSCLNITCISLFRLICQCHLIAAYLSALVGCWAWVNVQNCTYSLSSLSKRSEGILCWGISPLHLSCRASI